MTLYFVRNHSEPFALAAFFAALASSFSFSVTEVHIGFALNIKWSCRTYENEEAQRVA